MVWKNKPAWWAGSIYSATNLINGEQYVGLAEKYLVRWAGHCASAKKKGVKLRVHNAMAAYGVDNFKFEVLQHCRTIETMLRAEVRWIKKLHTFIGDPEGGGYNLTKGGEGCWGFSHRKISKRKMSVKALEVWRRENHRKLMITLHTGFVVPQDRRAKIAATLQGHRVSAATRRKIIETQQGRPLKAEHVAALKATWHMRAPVSDEARASMSMAQTARRKREAARAA